MKLIRTVDAEGAVLCHDVTQIIPGTFKGPAFRKGHVITKEDIPVLLSIGKENLYVWEKKEGMLHEDEAAAVLRDLAISAHMSASEPKEGKIELTADCDGLFKVDSGALRLVNRTPQMMIATRHGNTPVRKGDKLAGTRIIPLVIEEQKMNDLSACVREATGGRPILSLHPFVHKRIGIVTTGSEVYKGRIKDSFTPILERKLQEYDTEVVGHEVTDDDDRMTTAAIWKMVGFGADVVLCTGGMSVDPDDRTPLAIRNTGAEIVTYGAPVLPGAMFLLSYLQTEGSRTVTVCGLPGCVMYAKRTIFDLMLPRILANDRITADEIAALGEGGLCLGLQHLHLAKLRLRRVKYKEEKESVQEEYGNTEPAFTHFDAQGNAVMVDVSGKDITLREATAEGVIRMSQQCFELVRSGGMKKGDVLGVARIAGIMGAKRTAELIPLCHILNLTKASVDFELMPADRDARPGIRALCTVRCSGKTGVEMEALTGVSVALLTIYDMCKAVDRSMEMEQVRLVRKSGGKSGLFERVPHVIKSM